MDGTTVVGRFHLVVGRQVHGVAVFHNTIHFKPPVLGEPIIVDLVRGKHRDVVGIVPDRLHDLSTLVGSYTILHVTFHQSYCVWRWIWTV